MASQLLGLWSVPRARSTAFLRMMTERGDFVVVHEPFSRVTDFGRVAVGEISCVNAEEVKTALLGLAEQGPVFFKDTMDFRYPDVLGDSAFLRAVSHSVMIRNPQDVIASHLRLDPRADREAMGFRYLVELFDTVVDSTDQFPFVLDGDRLVTEPEATVQAYCDHAAIAFYPRAMQWDPGTLDDWGQASRWHQDVARTTGFTAPRSAAPLPASVRLIADAFTAYHQPFYQRLRARGDSSTAMSKHPHAS